jgi:hypothetical protein
MRRMTAGRAVEVWNFKWPRRQPGISVARFLGEDAYGRWLGLTEGDPWWTADRSRSGVFLSSFVVVVPRRAWWTACFNPADPLVDVDVVLPVRWVGDVLEIVDLELDVLQTADGRVHVRDRDEFARVRAAWGMPDDVARQAEAACEQVRAQVELGAELFGTVGTAWLARFLADAGALPRAAERTVPVEVARTGRPGTPR